MANKMIITTFASVLALVIINQWKIGHLLYQSHDRKSNHHDISDDVYTKCLENVFQNLPIGYGRYQLRKNMHIPEGMVTTFAHHHAAGNMDKWNHEKTFDEISIVKKDSNCSIWEIGANEMADQSKKFLDIYPNCAYHAYEPVPTFYNVLKRNWHRKKMMTTHPYGIGKVETSFSVSKSDMAGQATYLGDLKSAENGTTNEEKSIIRSFDYAIKDAGGKPTLIHINCEGCEWDLLPGAIESGFVDGIKVIQIGFHNYGEVGLGQRALEYCAIHKALSKTHMVDFLTPFAWEQWVLKK